MFNDLLKRQEEEMLADMLFMQFFTISRDRIFFVCAQTCCFCSIHTRLPLKRRRTNIIEVMHTGIFFLSNVFFFLCVSFPSKFQIRNHWCNFRIRSCQYDKIDRNPHRDPRGFGLWLKAVTEPNSAIHTAIAEWTRPESTENDGSVRFSDTGI